MIEAISIASNVQCKFQSAFIVTDMFLLRSLAIEALWDVNYYLLKNVGFHEHCQNEIFLRVQIVRDWNYWQEWGYFLKRFCYQFF